jgi:chemotaxis protein CheC
MIMPEKKPSLVYMDALREIGTIGAGRAATALAELLNCKVEISLPETKVIPLESVDKVLGNPEDLYFVLDIGLTGEIEGRIFFLLSPQEAKILGANLLGKTPEEIDIDDLMFRSSLKEIVNILSGSYIGALSDMVGMTLMYSVPSLALDMVAAILDFCFINIAQHSEEAIIVKTQLKIEHIDFKSLLLFFPHTHSMRKLLERLGVKE